MILETWDSQTLEILVGPKARGFRRDPGPKTLILGKTRELVSVEIWVGPETRDYVTETWDLRFKALEI